MINNHSNNPRKDYSYEQGTRLPDVRPVQNSSYSCYTETSLVSTATPTKQPAPNLESVESLVGPPVGNTGVNSINPPIAFIDYLAFTFKFDDRPQVLPPEQGLNVHEIYRREHLSLSFHYFLYELLFEVLGLPIDEIPSLFSQKSYKFYEYSARLGQYGYIAYGGDRQKNTVLVDLNATGCAKIKDWPKLQQWMQEYKAVITRVDAAHDDFKGETVSIQKALEWDDQGLFNMNGRPPETRLIDDRGSNKGKTLYVGDRSSVKFCRVYEKGKQLKDKESPWTRLEVEFKKGKRVIPLDILTNPSVYLAGAYPCTAFLSELQERIKTVKKAAGLMYKNLVAQAKKQFGRLINVMIRVEAGDYVAVIDSLSRGGTPKSLQAFDDYWYPDLECPI